MVDVVDEVPEAQIPQLLHLPQAERLIEADVEDLLNISLIVVQIVHLNKEVAGEVPHVSPLLTESSERLPAGPLLGGWTIRWWEMEKGRYPFSAESSFGQFVLSRLGRGMRRGLSGAGEWAFY